MRVRSGRINPCEENSRDSLLIGTIYNVDSGKALLIE